MNVTDVKLSSSELKIRGERVGIAFEKDVPRRIALQRMSMQIMKPANGDYTEALNSIFVDDLSQMRPFAPVYWQQYLWEHFPSGDPSANQPEPQTRKVGGAVSPPEFVKKTEPQFNNVARALRYSGATTLGVVVDTKGEPQDLRIVRPIGLGLDDAAITAVAQYRFKPAMENGSPVPVHVNVEVNFEIK